MRNGDKIKASIAIEKAKKKQRNYHWFAHLCCLYSNTLSNHPSSRFNCKLNLFCAIQAKNDNRYFHLMQFIMHSLIGARRERHNHFYLTVIQMLYIFLVENTKNGIYGVFLHFSKFGHISNL